MVDFRDHLSRQNRANRKLDGTGNGFFEEVKLKERRYLLEVIPNCGALAKYMPQSLEMHCS